MNRIFTTVCIFLLGVALIRIAEFSASHEAAMRKCMESHSFEVCQHTLKD